VAAAEVATVGTVLTVVEAVTTGMNTGVKGRHWGGLGVVPLEAVR
jgi:hypothetical protein